MKFDNFKYLHSLFSFLRLLIEYQYLGIFSYLFKLKISFQTPDVSSTHHQIRLIRIQKLLMVNEWQVVQLNLEICARL